MIEVTVEDIAYNYETLCSNGKAVERVLINVEYKFVASNDEFELSGKFKLTNELTREEAEQKIRGLLGG